MPNNWKKYKLIDVIDLIGGGTPKTSVKEYWDGNIPWLSVVDFNNGQKRVYDTEKKITEAGLKNSSTKLLKKGQLILSARGTVGVLSQLGRDMTFNQSCYGLDAKSSFTTNDYLYYLVGHNINQIKSNAYGSVFDTITRSTFENITITLPPLHEQTAIAEILSALDDKIELNLQTNKTLEDMANALYKHWFVDFGPFLNNTFIDSELGSIPKDWKVASLEELVTKLGDGLHGTPKFTDDGEYYFVNGNNLSNGRILIKDETKRVSREEYEKYKKELNDRTLLVSINGTIGNIAAYSGEKIMLGKSACYFNVKEEVSKGYVMRVISSNYFTNYIESSFTGSVIKNISLKTMRELPIIVPPITVQHNFEHIVNSMSNFQDELHFETQTLKQTRDYLLPKLISGEIRVKEATKKIKDLV